MGLGSTQHQPLTVPLCLCFTYLFVLLHCWTEFLKGQSHTCYLHPSMPLVQPVLSVTSFQRLGGDPGRCGIRKSQEGSMLRDLEETAGLCSWVLSFLERMAVCDPGKSDWTVRASSAGRQGVGVPVDSCMRKDS